MAERVDRQWQWPDLVLIALLAGTLAAPYYAFSAAFPDCMMCIGYVPDPADEAQDRREVVLALVLGTVLPAAGMALGTWSKRHGWRWAFGILMTVCLLLTVVAWQANR